MTLTWDDRGDGSGTTIIVINDNDDENDDKGNGNRWDAVAEQRMNDTELEDKWYTLYLNWRYCKAIVLLYNSTHGRFP